MLVIGLMSGTSADGVDAALVKVTGKFQRVRVNLLGFITDPYPALIRQQVLRASSADGIPTAELAVLNVKLGGRFARAALKVCEKAGIDIKKVDLIGSHGQTVSHQPEKRATLQIGEPAAIAGFTGRPVVADFRPADMVAGGQGAPLTPLTDYLLLRHPRRNVVVVNIGGITNLTSLPAGIKDPNDLIAFDAGPGNMLMDSLVHKITKGKKKFDRGGKIARTGIVNGTWLIELLMHPYLKKKLPKSAGHEQFGAHYLDQLIKKYRIRTNRGRRDMLATLTLFTATAIADSINRYIIKKHPVDEVLVCGGGAKNAYLMEMIRNEMALIGWIKLGKELRSPIRVGVTDDVGVPAAAREAMAFALLARETWEGRPGNVPSATGAKKAVILGKIVRP